jgi:hypothetical protein
MKKTLISLCFLLISSMAFADQTALITCTGEKIILTSKSPYWGENSAANQTLYTLKSKDNQGESIETAYFLNIEEGADVDKYGMVYTYGKNNKGGSFTLKVKFWEDVGDGAVVNQKTVGTLTYKHGHLKGTEEAVSCTRN